MEGNYLLFLINVSIFENLKGNLSQYDAYVIAVISVCYLFWARKICRDNTERKVELGLLKTNLGQPIIGHMIDMIRVVCIALFNQHNPLLLQLEQKQSEHHHWQQSTTHTLVAWLSVKSETNSTPKVVKPFEDGQQWYSHLYFNNITLSVEIKFFK